MDYLTEGAVYEIRGRGDPFNEINFAVGNERIIGRDRNLWRVEPSDAEARARRDYATKHWNRWTSVNPTKEGLLLWYVGHKYVFYRFRSGAGTYASMNPSYA